MTESYSERQRRKPPIGIEALVELVFFKLRDFERRGYFDEAFNTWEDPAGDIHEPRLSRPEEYVITHLARPGLWTWLGDLDRVAGERDFPPWDLDTLFDVIELFHNVVVSAPMFDADGTFEGFWSQRTGQEEFREAMNEVLALHAPAARLAEDGRIVECVYTARQVYDVFISHAHEDKDAIARPLGRELARRGYRVFLDENELVAGDSLYARLSEALASTRSGVVILSPAFFAKSWPRHELDALMARELGDGSSLIIPIWHGVGAEEVRAVYPALADRLALSTDAGLEAVVVGVVRAIQRGRSEEPRVAGAGGEPQSVVKPDDITPGETSGQPRSRRIPLVSWLAKHERISVGDYIAVAVIGTLIAAGVLTLIALLRSSNKNGSTANGPVTSQTSHAATRVGGGASILPAGQFQVMNAAGGVYWRSAPDWNTAEATPRKGFYPNTVIAVTCYQAGAANVPGSTDAIWEQASWVSGPGSGHGWINEHFINDGSPINQPSAGIPACASRSGGASGGTQETVGGVAHTWTKYAKAGGVQGPSLATGQAVIVACKVQGFRVADGDTWWYRIASSPWDGTYYVSADGFYNNGATSGSLVGTPFVDINVPNC